MGQRSQQEVVVVVRFSAQRRNYGPLGAEACLGAEENRKRDGKAKDDLRYVAVQYGLHELRYHYDVAALQQNILVQARALPYLSVPKGKCLLLSKSPTNNFNIVLGGEGSQSAGET